MRHPPTGAGCRRRTASPAPLPKLETVNPGNRTVLVAILGVLGAFAASDAGHEDEDSFKSNWLVAALDCRGEPTAEAKLTLPEHLVVMTASAQVSPGWTSYRDCESR
jgi:uncharacterized protein YcnI